jgi:Putative adhesin
MTAWDFPCSDPIDIAIDSWASGSIVLAGEPTDTVVVEVVPSHRSRAADVLDQVEVEFDDGQLAIRGPRIIPSWRRSGLDLTIKAPTGSSCAAKTASADLSCVGTVSAVSLNTASGDLSAQTVTGDVTVRSASGDMLLAAVGGSLTVHTASGDTRAARVDGEVRINTASGDVTIGYCANDVTTKTASGDVQLDAVASGDVELASASGDIKVAVVPGIGVYLDLSSTSGRVTSDLDEVDSAEAAAPGGPTVEVRARTLSGDIHVSRADVARRDSHTATPASAE